MIEIYMGFLKIGIIKELTKQGVLTEVAQEKIIKQIEKKHNIEV